MIDETDRQILMILQENGRTSNADIARRIGMAPSGVLERIRKLEEKKIIRGYYVDIDPKALGLDVMAYIFVKAEKKLIDTAAELSKIPEVLEVHHICGEDCYMVRALASDTEALGQLLEDKINGIASVNSTRTTIVLSTLKETNRLPIREYSKVLND